ncbi:MAG: diacylglycerol kinase family lipid kinase [Syntrophotaleaceae bacterium]
MKILLIANPVAGGNARLKIARAVDLLETRGASVKLVLTDSRGDARRAAEAARESGFDRIVAAGGDGTLNEVINGLAPSTIPLAFIPLGTTNVFALEVNIPFDLDKACDLVLQGIPRAVSVGLAGDTRFLLMAGIGFDAEVVAAVSLRLKRRIGKLAYIVSGLRTLVRPTKEPFEVLSDGIRCRACAALIGNGRLYGGRFSITDGASLLEDLLDVRLFLRPGRLRLLVNVARILLGYPPGKKEMLHFKTRHVRMTGADIPVQIDGDSHGCLPQTFQAIFGELTLVFPP